MDGAVDGAVAVGSYSPFRSAGVAAGLPFNEPLGRKGGAPFAYLGGQEFPADAWSPQLEIKLILQRFAKTGWDEGDRAIQVENPDDGDLALRREVHDLITMRNNDRPHRAAEIVAQVGNCEAYWSNLLMMGAGNRPATQKLIMLAMQVGQMVALHFKYKIGRARPVQVCPALMPLVPTPPHASYPSGHATQMTLIATLIAALFDEGEAHAMARYAAALAQRIAENREIAGVHFRSDTQAGQQLAKDTFHGFLKEMPEVKALLAEARAEWSGITCSFVPDPETLPDLEGGTSLSRKISTAVADRLANDLPDLIAAALNNDSDSGPKKPGRPDKPFKDGSKESP
ncbi:MAG: hypothetical protein ACJARR_002693 [Pseudophaeobacter arcticus]